MYLTEEIRFKLEETKIDVPEYVGICFISKVNINGFNESGEMFITTEWVKSEGVIRFNSKSASKDIDDICEEILLDLQAWFDDHEPCESERDEYHEYIDGLINPRIF